ncbi:MAG: hypothetical protein ACE367_23445 [Acidimicrobiales bacterium]
MNPVLPGSGEVLYAAIVLGAVVAVCTVGVLVGLQLVRRRRAAGIEGSPFLPESGSGDEGGRR